MSEFTTMPGAVSLDSLLASIRSAVDSGRIGTPVNVRVHWQFSETSLSEAALVAARIADEALALDQPSWRVRTGGLDVAQGRILNLLGEDQRGRTVLVTVCRGPVSEFALTVFGNHGTLRLEHAGLDEKSSAGEAEPGWQEGLLRQLAEAISS